MQPTIPDNLNPLIDADILLYRCGFAAEGEPVENALQNVKTILNKVRDKFPNRKWERMYLTGSNNFRNSVATVKPYKGNRDPSHKPSHYGDIKRYLIEHHGAILVEGMEADDALGIEQWANKDRSTVIVSTDKDMLMIPGFHYNWVKDTWQLRTLHEANTFFWWQMLVGDPTDNIPGIHGIGKVKADKIVAECEGDLAKLRERVEKEYQRQYGDEWQSIMREIGMLLWIKREEDKTWMHHKV